jgi:hypothetical protein
MRFMENHIDTLYVIQGPTAKPSTTFSISSFAEPGFSDKNDSKTRATKGAIHFVNTSPAM